MEWVDIHFRSTAPTTQAGVVAIAFDWGATETGYTFDKLKQTTPHKICACYQSTQIRIRGTDLMQQTYLRTHGTDDSGAGQIVVYAQSPLTGTETHVIVGYLEIDYKIELAFSRPN